MTTSIISVPFHNQNLLATIVDGIPHVAMKPICENIGISWNSQFERIKRHAVLSEGIRVIRTPSKGGIQEMITLPIDLLNGWLFGVDSNRIKKPEVKTKVIEYQKECFKVLANHFMPKRNALVDLPTHLPAKKQHLKNVVLTIARKNAEGYGAVYNRLFTALGIDKLANLTDKHYIPACNYLNVKPKVFDGELLPTAKEEAKEETQDNSITLTLKPLVNNKHRRVLVTQAKDFMVTLWELDDDQQVLTEQTAIRELRELGYLVLKNDDASINKLVFSYLPSDKLPIFIEKAANRIRAIQQAKSMPA